MASTGRSRRTRRYHRRSCSVRTRRFSFSAQSEESLRWAAQYDIPFAQIDSIVEQAKRDQAFYREVQTAHGHPPTARLYLMREIYVADTDTRASAEARPYLLQYWELWNRYTQFTQDGKLPDSYDFWRRQAPMLHAMSFDQIVANDMVILGGPERVANTILRLANQLDLMGLTMIFKLGAMPYDMVERSMSLFGEEVVPRLRQILTRAVTVDRTTAEPSSSIQRAASYSPPASCPAVWPPIASTARPARSRR